MILFASFPCLCKATPLLLVSKWPCVCWQITFICVTSKDGNTDTMQLMNRGGGGAEMMWDA